MPLHAVLARMDALVTPVAPREVSPAAAIGRVLACDLLLTRQPRADLALRDGWAVNSALTQDAGPYAPAPLAGAAPIDTGEPLPVGTDAVAEIDAVVFCDGGPQAVAPVTSGDGVLPAGADADGGTILARDGHRLGAVAAAALAERIRVREPRVQVVGMRADRIIDAAVDLLAHAITRAGGIALRDCGESLDAALRCENADAVISIGGTGSGRQDATVIKLAGLGRVEAHGIAISPGETAAFGMIKTRPVLMLPGRIDAALAGWLLLGQPLLARLAASRDEPPALPARLARKVASNLGIAEFVPVRLREGEAEPLGGPYLPLQTLARANGWMLIPPDSEGYPEGATVMVRALP
ncbi:MAG TPA: molybdopterin-binding protein [Xanthobacteraceae bacterium]|nr:molybdopterin-binding protein [Xanthobacteraceae bacterium]